MKKVVVESLIFSWRIVFIEYIQSNNNLQKKYLKFHSGVREIGNMQFFKIQIPQSSTDNHVINSEILTQYISQFPLILLK